LTIERHPSVQLLTSYAVGDLALAAGLSVAAHLGVCRDCRIKVSEVEEAEGAAIAGAAGAPMADGALAQALRNLETPPQSARNRAPRSVGGVELPAAISELGLARRRWVAPGFWAARAKAPATDGWRTFLLRAPALAHIPHHDHVGRELICVLSGAFRDGVTYAAGDFAEHPPGSGHDLTVSSDAPCACLISLQGATRWRGWSKVIPPVLGL
jgi:putative transcriptional regulator